MTWPRNLLISIGAYWLSDCLVVLAVFAFGKLTDGIIYGGSMFSAVAMGIVTSMGRAACAAIGAVIATRWAVGPKPQRWALVVALLYMVASRPRYHYVAPPTTWDRVSDAANLAWPAIACVATAGLVGWLRRGSQRRSQGG